MDLVEECGRQRLAVRGDKPIAHAGLAVDAKWQTDQGARAALQPALLWKELDSGQAVNIHQSLPKQPDVLARFCLREEQP